MTTIANKPALTAAIGDMLPVNRAGADGHILAEDIFSIGGLVNFIHMVEDASVASNTECFSQTTFTPSHTKWTPDPASDFAFVGDVPTYVATSNGYGDLAQLVSDLAAPLVDGGTYRLTVVLQNVTTGDLLIEVYGDNFSSDFIRPIANGTQHIDFIYHTSPSVIFEGYGSTGQFEVVSLSLKRIGTPARFQLDNEGSDDTNYERLGIFWQNDVLNINIEKGGTGSTRFPKLNIGGNQFLAFPVTNGLALGQNAGISITTGQSNYCIGKNAGSALTTGENNTLIGEQAGYSLINNTNCIFIGHLCGVNHTNGDGNIAIGGYGGITGQQNTVIGGNAMSAASNESYCTVVGFAALQGLLTGSDITVVGRYALHLTTGGENAAFGSSAGITNTSGEKNLFLGTFADCSIATLHHAAAIGYGAIVSANNAMVLGGTGANAINVSVGVAAPTARMHLPAGTATAGSAPLKLVTGVNLTTPEDGVFEYNGTNLFFTVGGTRKTVTLL